MRLGLLGGTFDPIHVGHLELARVARQALSLDRLVLLPSNVPPHRTPPHASAAHRFAMTALAIQDEEGLETSDLELLADGPSFTSRTLDRLAGQGLDTRTVFFVTGADAFRDIRSWRDYPDLVDRCHFVVVSRPEFPVAALPGALPDLADRMVAPPYAPPAGPGIFLLDAVTPAVSSTEIRQRIARGASIAGLVPPAVAGHIARHRLYQPRVTQGAG